MSDEINIPEAVSGFLCTNPSCDYLLDEEDKQHKGWCYHEVQNVLRWMREECAKVSDSMAATSAFNHSAVLLGQETSRKIRMIGTQ